MNELMEKRSIGRTGFETRRLGIGSTFDAPAEAIEAAFEWGVNYLYWGTVRQPDFAKAMRNIAKTRRDDMILTIQSYSDDPGTIEAEVAEQIKVSGIDHYDFLLLGNRMEKPHDGYLETFERMREKGMVGFLSLSSHNRLLIPELLDEYARGESPYDLLMFRYNAVHRGAERDIFPYVPSTRPALKTYTATRWGHLLDPDKMPPGEAPVSARDCYRYSLSHSAIDLVCAGPGSAAQMEEAISALEAGPLSPEEKARIERIGAYQYGEYAPAYGDRGDAADIAAGRSKAPER